MHKGKRDPEASQVEANRYQVPKKAAHQKRNHIGVPKKMNVIDAVSPKAGFRDPHTIDFISWVCGVESHVTRWVSCWDNDCKIL